MLTIDDVNKELSRYGKDLNKACVDMGNRGIGHIKSWVLKGYCERHGALSETQSALLTAYIQILEMERAINAGDI